MKTTPTTLPDVLVLEPQVFGDERGYFYESYNARRFEQATGIAASFVQDNQSRSARNVLRGLHYQHKRPQGKLIRVLSGSIYDVTVDLRRASPTFGQWSGMELSADNRKQLWVPAGFAHGFVVTSDSAECLYKTTAYWDPEDEHCLLWNDPALAIAWPLDGPPVLSAKDRAGRLLADAATFP